MSEELKQAMQAFATKLLNEGSNAIDFGKEQIPLVVQEYLRWTAWQAGVATAGGILLLVAAYRLGRWTHRLATSNGPEEPFCVFTGVGTAVTAVCGSIAVCTNVLMLVKVLTAPRLVVLDLVKSLL